MSFVHTHLHTDRSIMDGLSSPEQVAKRVKELGQPGFFITDHGTTSGLMAGYHAAKKEGLKFGFGVEFYFVPDVTIKERKAYHLILLAKNNIGYYNLLKLTTIANQPENFYYKPRIDFDILKQYSEGLIATSACMGGILSISHKEQRVVTINEQVIGDVGIEEVEVNDAEKWIPRFKELFGSDFYIELHTNTIPGQKEFNLRAVQLGAKFNIPFLAACDSHYVLKKDASTHRAWKGIGEDEENEYYGTDDFYIMSEKEVRDGINYLPSDIVDNAIINTGLLIDQCNVELDFKTKHYPVFPVDNQKEFLVNLVQEGFAKKFPNWFPELDDYLERIDYELEVLDKADYINYFLITWDILNWCHSSGIYTGVGRGSITASLVAYLIGITKIDPIKYSLIFERFAHLERVTPPDIDIDVMKSRRGEVLDYIRSKYGTVYQVRTFGMMEEKGAKKRAGQALGIEPSLVNAINAGKAPCPPELQLLADKFKGTLQNYGCHASAMVVFDGDPCRFTAIERQGENYVAAYDFHDLEELGVLKQDILGLKTCDVIKWTMDMVGGDLDIDDLPEDDELTLSMLRDGKTSGCFQIESPGMTNLVKQMQPKHYRDLIPLVALYRPGPNDAKLPGTSLTMVDLFVLRRRGEMEIDYLHPALEPILGYTYGVIVYQEQILQIVRELCGYTLGQADVLRRIIGRKEIEKIQEGVDELVVRGMANGIPEATIKQIADQIVTFAKYGFNQGHSTAYGYIAYQTAYLKAHYPKEFMCNLINSEESQEKILPYVDECKKIGIPILRPDIVKSDNIWSIQDGGLRVGLSYIKNVGNLTIDKSCGHNFVAFMEYNSGINKRAIECLIKAGAFGDYNRGLALEQLGWYKTDLPRIKECEYKISLGKKVEYWQAQRDRVREMPTHIPFLTYQEVDGELDVLGFSFTDKISLYDSSYCRKYNPDSVLEQTVLGEVKKIKPWTTKKKKPMAFVTIYTSTGNHDIVVFDNILKRCEIMAGEVYVFTIEEGVVRALEAAEPLF